MSVFQNFSLKWKRSGGILLVALLAASLLLATNDQRAEQATALPIESRLQSVLSKVQGAGDVSVLVNSDDAGAIIGVCVLTPHADDVGVVFRLQRAVRTALGIENDRVEILAMEELQR